MEVRDSWGQCVGTVCVFGVSPQVRVYPWGWGPKRYIGGKINVKWLFEFSGLRYMDFCPLGSELKRHMEPLPGDQHLFKGTWCHGFTH